jgi:threonine dehydrogenase-like Zn-dependent dehydrogenase
MTATLIPPIEETKPFATHTMRATVFHGVGDIRVEDVPRPRPDAGEALIRVTTTTICGTDLHIVRGEYPVRPGLVIGHEPVGVIAELGAGVAGYNVGDRVLVGAITPCGQCLACLSGHHSQCGHGGTCEAARGLAVREHDRRGAGGVSARAERAGEHGQDPGRADR